MSDTGGSNFLGSFLNSQSGADTGAFPGSTDNTLTPTQSAALSGVTRIKGAIPVMIKRAGPMTQGLSADPQGGGTPAEIRRYEEVLSGLYRLPDDQLAALQQELLAGGFYQDDGYYKGTKRVVFGLADPDTFNAWKEAVTRAAASEKTVDEVLQEAAKKTGAQPGGATAKPAVRLTNPTDLRDIARQEGQSLLGRNPDPGFVDNYVAAFHAQEAAGQTIDPNTGELVQAADPRTYVREMLRRQYPVDVGVNDYLNVGNEIVNTLAAPAGGTLPTTRTANG